MAQIFRILIGYPFLFLLQNAIQRVSFIVGLVALTAVLFFANGHISNILPTSLLPSTSGNIQTESTEITREVTIKNGDTLGAILRNQQLPNEDIRELVKLSSLSQIASNLKIGQNLVFNYSIELSENSESDLNQEKLVLSRMTLKLDKVNSIEFVRRDDKFAVHHISAPLTKLVTQYEATIDSSVVASLKAAGMSGNSINELINSYSHQIDFQRQIQSGDKITVITEKFVTSEGDLSHHGKILYASLQTKNKDYNIYRYSPTGREEGTQFFSEDGDSIKSNLLRTPLKVARVSSHFGHRHHPTLGYNKMHKGVDFAAAVGTPIQAAGNGEVSFVGWKDGYGKIITIKHSGGMSTAYAHASKFANNIKKGSKVKQGDVIAYVGKSGRATGAHLHFEVLINGKHVNPMKFKSTPSIVLAGDKLSKFKKYKGQLQNLSKKLNQHTELAVDDVTEIKIY